jgi:hypothetical protein
VKKILLQLDPDLQASVFDSVVAVDAEVDHLFRHQAVTPDQVMSLVHGCIFTRGHADLNHTAIFIGGSDVTAGESLLKRVKKSFFGPMRVSVMMDANGCNTTAAAAVIAAGRHCELKQATVAVLAGTGPVGQRVARLCLRSGASVKLCSRSLEKSTAVCESLQENPAGQLSAAQTASAKETAAVLKDVDVVFACGAAGVELLPDETRKQLAAKVLVDLNAVPPLGIGGVEVMDKATQRDSQICYGAIGVGGTKMKIHKAVLGKLFDKNDQVFDAEEIMDVGLSLEQG